MISNGGDNYQATPRHSRYGEMIVMIPSAQSPSTLNQLPHTGQSGQTQVQLQDQNHHNYIDQSRHETQGPARPLPISRQDVSLFAQSRQYLYVTPPQFEQQPPPQMIVHNLVDGANARPLPKKPKRTSSQHSPAQLMKQASTPQHANPIVQAPIVQIPAPAKAVIQSDSTMDYRILLLTLAEQYISEARSMAVSVSLAQPSMGRERYQDLMAAGLTCMETVIKKVFRILPRSLAAYALTPVKQQTWRVSPRQEALLQFRYATLLFEETEDHSVAESLLGKGVRYGFLVHHKQGRINSLADIILHDGVLMDRHWSYTQALIYSESST